MNKAEFLLWALCIAMVTTYFCYVFTHQRLPGDRIIIKDSFNTLIQK